jgi:UDP:flavonoid glycosyltransferase YjiC (YdhE family)
VTSHHSASGRNLRARYATRGVAPIAIPLRRVDSAALAAALTTVTTEPAYRMRARTIAERIAGEDGAGAVARAVEKTH